MRRTREGWARQPRPQDPPARWRPAWDRRGERRDLKRARSGRWTQEQGSGTVYVTGIITVVAASAVLIGGLIQAQVASGSARAAADMAALSGAQAASSLLGGAEPCAVAGAVAQANGARLESCTVSGEDVTVSVAVPARVLGISRLARAQARAGPADADSAGESGGLLGSSGQQQP